MFYRYFMTRFSCIDGTIVINGKFSFVFVAVYVNIHNSFYQSGLILQLVLLSSLIQINISYNDIFILPSIFLSS